MQLLIKYTILFFFYSFAGWCLESLYCSIGEKRFINRGFLTGPLCPIYGTAAVILTLLIYNPFKDNALMVFILGIVFCDILEFFVSLIMEKLFAARWWDYTYEFCNLSGRICLKHTLYWGIISVVFVNVIHPYIDNLYNQINGVYLNYILIAILVIFTFDVLNAVRKAMDIRKLEMTFTKVYNVLSKSYEDLKDNVEEKYTTIQNSIEKYSGAVSDFKYQVEDLLYQFDLHFTGKSNKKNNKKESLSNRLFYNNPGFERRTKKQLEKLQSLIDAIKSNLFENEDMQ